MTSRFSYFSHIEDLGTGQLILTSPFNDRPDQPSICQYELHRQSSGIVNPDPEFSGAAAYHRLLPLQSESEIAPLNNQPVYVDFSSVPLAGEFGIANLKKATPNPALPWLITSQQAREASIGNLLYPALCTGDLSFFKWHDSANHMLAVPEAWRAACPSGSGVYFFDGPFPDLEAPDSFTNAGPWHHPFRMEGMKVVGLDLFHRFEDAPTIVLFDPTGEWLFAFFLAFKSIQRLHPGTLPYRVVLVQYQPFHHICRLFEGSTYDPGNLTQAIHPAYLPLPKPIRPWVRDAIFEMAGTCVAIQAESDQNTDSPWYVPALEILTRTLFIEAEDPVILIDPFHHIPPSSLSEGA